VLERLGEWGPRDLGDEGYILEVTPAQITASATTSRGLYYAVRTLQQLVDTRTKSVPALKIVDWPEVRDRMMLYDFRWDNVNVQYMKRWIRELSRLKYNQIMIFLSGDYRFEKYPFIAPPEKWTPEKLRELKEYARQYHIVLLPQLESLGHAEGVLRHDAFKEMRLAKDNAYSYSPCTEKTYTLLGELYTELTKEFDQSDLFHVGGDEVWGFEQDARCAGTIKQKGAKYLYAQHMNRLSALLKSFNRRMAIWGDMLLEYPGADEGLDRDTVIFDWDYSENKTQFEDFPSLRKFKDMGFKNIVATPAVLGFSDMYPIFPTAFQNIRGFTRAALREDIRSVCVTMWQMEPGNNAENYLYGLAWAAQILWSPLAGDAGDFNRRFASAWLDIRDSRAAAQVDRAEWFPWRVTGSSEITDRDAEGFWQKQFQSGHFLYSDFTEVVKSRTVAEVETMPAVARVLLKNIRAAKVSAEWLKARAGRNPMTLQSMDMTFAFHTYMARKVEIVMGASIAYRQAFAARDKAAAERALSRAVRGLRALSGQIPELRAQLTLAVNERNRHPDELGLLERERDSLLRFYGALKKSRREIAGGGWPTPESLSLQPWP
jgi:hypothetical protein